MSYGLIGEKLGHSYSKKIHESLGRYTYDLIELDADNFGPFMKERNFKGLNVTIPYKKAVIPFCDELTAIAAAIGSVNTLYFKNGKLTGDNTDYYGFLYMVKHSGISIKDKKVLILGAGGSSLMVLKAVKDLNAAEVLVVSRNGLGANISLAQVNEHLDAQIIINATPVGMYPFNGKAILSVKDFPLCQGVIDLIYNPLLTRLLYEAKNLGIPYANGLSMLVAQALKAFEIFTETSVDPDIIEATTLSLENETRNIVLIGMPGCGKTTLGKLLAQELNRPFVDTDFLAETETGLTIPQLFEKFGEGEFRRIENLVSKEVGMGQGQVISTGGGIVLNPRNMEYLSQNGTVIFLDRPLKKLAQDGRPLSKSFAALEEMAFQRIPLYKDYSDITISTVEDPFENVDMIIKILGGK